jgi:multimeric flavodoxin WrbA
MEEIKYGEMNKLYATESDVVEDKIAEKKDKLRIIGVCCSPRKNGNTQIMLETALKAAKEEGGERVETELILMAGKKLQPCDACESCGKTKKCHVKDDMQEVFPKLWTADAIIIGSPTYGLSISSITRIFLDRATGMHAQWLSGKDGKNGKGFTHTVGGAIIAAGRCGASLASMNIIGEFALGQWIFGGAAWGYGWDRGDILKDKLGLDEAVALGKRIYKFTRQWSFVPDIGAK